MKILSGFSAFRDKYLAAKKSIITAVLLAIVLGVSGQGGRPVHDPRAVPPVNSFMNVWKGGAFDSVLHVPRYIFNYKYDNDTTPFIFVVGNALRYYSQGSYYDVSGGSSIDTSSLSNRINLRLLISDTAAMLAPYITTAEANAAFYLNSNPAQYISNIVGLIQPGGGVGMIGGGMVGNPYILSSPLVTLGPLDIESSGNPDSTRTLSLLISPEVGNGLSILPSGLFGQGIISDGVLGTGPVVTWTGVGYIYHITAGYYKIGNATYLSRDTTITLDAPDGTFDRFDVFVGNDQSQITVVDGIPAATPLQPSIDPSTQLEISFADVQTGTTTPTINTTCIYQENTEWTGTSSTTRINLIGTTAPCAGTKDIDGTAVRNGDFFFFTNPAGLSDPRTLYSILSFFIKSKATWNANKSIRIQLRNGTTVLGTVSLPTGAFGFNSANTTTCQTIALPLANFGLPATALIDNIIFTAVEPNGTFGWTVDNICLQGQPLIPPVATGNFVQNGVGTPGIRSNISSARPAASATDAGWWFADITNKLLERDNGTGYDTFGLGAQRLTGDARGTLIGNTILDTVYALQGNTLGTQIVGGYLYDSLGHLVWHFANDTTFIRYNGVTGNKLIIPNGRTLNTPRFRDSLNFHLVLNSGTDSSLTGYVDLTGYASSLTTTGTSGVATLSGGVLNIPNYTYTLPTASTSVLGGVKVDGSTITISGGVISAAGGSGSVTDFTAGNLSPLFTTSVATSTSTPALTFTLSNAAAHSYLGNNTGSSAAPSFLTNTQVTADLNLFSSSLKGLVPASGGSATDFLNGSGTWTAPATPGIDAVLGVQDTAYNKSFLMLDAAGNTVIDFEPASEFLTLSVYSASNNPVAAITLFNGDSTIDLSSFNGLSIGTGPGGIPAFFLKQQSAQISSSTLYWPSLLNVGGDTLATLADVRTGGGGGGGAFLPLTFPGDQTVDGGTFELAFSNLSVFDVTSSSSAKIQNQTSDGKSWMFLGDTSAEFHALDVTETFESILRVTPNTIQLQPTGFASALAGYVWTNTDPTTGAGAWMAAAGGLSGTGIVSASGASISYNTTSASIAGIISDETGSGALVFGTSPTIATPALTGAITRTGVPTVTTGTYFDIIGTDSIERHITPANALALLGAGTVTGSASSNQMTFWSSSTAAAGSANNVWDNTNFTQTVTTPTTSNTFYPSFVAQNTATASATNQMQGGFYYSVGNGWKTTATAASQEVGFRWGTVPVQGAANPTGQWTLQQNINGGAYASDFTINSNALPLILDNAGFNVGNQAATYTFQTTRSNTGAGVYIFTMTDFNNETYASGTGGDLQLAGGFAPASGSAVWNVLDVKPIINQTGGASGITRGLYIEPTLTAVADWRAIEVASGKTILGASTTGGASLNVPSGTAPTSPNNGDLWYDGSHYQARTNGVTQQLDDQFEDIEALQALGSVIKGQSVGMTSPVLINASTTMSNQLMLIQAVRVKTGGTITGVKWVQGVQGSYTANNYNGVQLCSYSGGTLTSIASSTNNGSIWSTATANTVGTQAFSGTVSVTPGIYFVVALYCRSAETTAPKLGSFGSTIAPNGLDFTNSAKLFSTLASQTAVISSQAMSGLTVANGGIWFELY